MMIEVITSTAVVNEMLAKQDDRIDKLEKQLAYEVPDIPMPLVEEYEAGLKAGCLKNDQRVAELEKQVDRYKRWDTWIKRQEEVLDTEYLDPDEGKAGESYDHNEYIGSIKIYVDELRDRIAELEATNTVSINFLREAVREIGALEDEIAGLKAACSLWERLSKDKDHHAAELEKQLAGAKVRIEKYELLDIEAEILMKGFDGADLNDELESGE